ncbi:MAG: hypothetical protein ACI8W8_001184 [Rhodothermales bacterium]|jgi:hypothetical protein
MRFELASLLFLLPMTMVAEEAINFSRDIRPILSDKCYHCHGPDKNTREAKLRLDIREGVLADLDGHAAVVPGKPMDSELVARILSTDEDEVMPPPKSNKTLTAAQKNLLKRWIAEGAEYAGHWAFIPPTAPTPPTVTGRVKNPVDQFILRKLKEHGLPPTEEASRETLIRRVALDLTGLPPTPAEAATYLADNQPDAYERMVDRYLASEQYGEHMARYWLDIARYADTDGYQYDKARTQWPWRDWVIRAYNANMPFDQFTIEQLAGDKLANPTTGQRIATGFNRNHPITIEGGTIDEEYRVEYVMDRVVTTTQAWLAMSIGCARCHDHKYDPVSQDEFYQTFSFFNNVADRGTGGFAPQLTVQAPEIVEQIADLDAKLATARATEPTDAELKAWEASPLTERQQWAAIATPSAFTALKIVPTPETLTAEIVPADSVTVAGRFVRVSVVRKAQYLSLAEVQVFTGGKNVAQGKKARQSTNSGGADAGRAVDGRTDGAYTRGSTTHTAQQDNPWWEVDLGQSVVVNQLKIWNRTDCCTERLENFSVEVLDENRKRVWQKTGQPAPKLSATFDVGGPIAVPLVRHGDLWLPKERVGVPANHTLETRLAPEGNYSVSSSNADSWLEVAALSPEVASILKTKTRTAPQIAQLKAHLRDHSPSRQGVRDGWDAIAAQRAKLASTPSAKMLVMQDLAKPRKTYFLERGQYDQRRHELQAAVPSVLGAMDEDLPRNRLGFAKWLVNPKHPLTARVAVNRYWHRLFGVGIVKTVEEFGAQGEWPSHPELLDWLATEFVRSGWDVKAMQRLIVTSATYRQAADFKSKSFAMDPENRLLGRGPRYRLDAEVIRDSALALSGLLEQHIGGPSVYPYQPAGLWMEINNRRGYSSAYPKPAADQLYRRSVYTFWKRTLPNPQMQTFDAPNREFCTVTRSKTNTPLQALALMHDPQYVEAGRHLAKRIIKEGGTSSAERLTYGFRLVTGRSPSAAEMATLSRFLGEEKARFDANSAAAESALAVGLSARDTSLDASEHALWLTMARLLLNLDEVINKG